MAADLLAQARLSRADAVDELARRWQPGQHLTCLGPTGRGKSTLLGQVLPRTVHSRVVICCPKGADPAYRRLGRATMTWPPRRRMSDTMREVYAGTPDPDGRQVWRIELPMRKVEDFDRLAALYRAVLSDALARPETPKDSLLVLLDDSRLISEGRHMNLGGLVTANLMIGRSKGVSIVNNYQAPRFVPREGLDQVSHLLIWRNRDTDVAKRLAEVGDVDPALTLAILRRLDYHEALWIDAIHDELFIVGQ